MMLIGKLKDKLVSIKKKKKKTERIKRNSETIIFDDIVRLIVSFK